MMRQLTISKSITCRDGGSFDKYLAEVAREELLSPEEETTLAIKVQNGDEAALDKLVKANLRFVISVAKQYDNPNIPLNDLVNEGNIGLIKAAHKFDPSRGFRFISYAVWWIRQSIIEAIEKQGATIRIPSSQHDLISMYRKAASELEGRLERFPTSDELASHLGWDIDSTNSITNLAMRKVSLQSSLNDDEDSGVLLDVIEDESAEPADRKVEYYESLDMTIQNVLSELTEVGRNVIILSFGLNGNNALSFAETAEELGMSISRVRQLYNSSIRKLNKRSNARMLAEYLG